MLQGVPSLMTARGVSASLLTGLLSYYKLEDVNDSGPNTATLTNHGTVTFVSGKVGNCANFVSASNQWLSTANGAGNQFGTGDFSFAFWFNTASANNFMQVINYNHRNASPCYYFEISSGGYQGGINDNAGHNLNLATAGIANDGNWHLIVVTVTRSGNYTLDLDSINKINSSASTLTGSMNGSFGLGLGADEAGTNLYDGKIDEVGLWSRALTQSERDTLWNSGNGTTYPF